MLCCAVLNTCVLVAVVCHRGRVLEDGQTLSGQGILHGHTLHLVEQDPAAAVAAAAAAAAAQQQQQPQPMGGPQVDPRQVLLSMFGGGGAAPGAALEPGVAVQVGPFEVGPGAAASWQQVAAALGGMAAPQPQPAGQMAGLTCWMRLTCCSSSWRQRLAAAAAPPAQLRQTAGWPCLPSTSRRGRTQLV